MRKKIAVEITISKINAKYIEETVNTWNADKYWFISYKGFTKSATDLIAKRNNIILTTVADIEKLLKKTT